MQELQILYVLEALLARVGLSEHRKDFVIKGGVLLAAFAVRRPTKDIDLQATGLANDAAEVAARLRAIAALDLPDGVVVDLESRRRAREARRCAGASTADHRCRRELRRPIRLHRVDAEEFGVSLETVAAHRQIGLLPLLPALSSMAQHAPPKWRAWRARMRRENDLPIGFADTLETVAAFADPALRRTAAGVWNPQSGAWRSDDPRPTTRNEAALRGQ